MGRFTSRPCFLKEHILAGSPKWRNTKATDEEREDQCERPFFQEQTLLTNQNYDIKDPTDEEARALKAKTEKKSKGHYTNLKDIIDQKPKNEENPKLKTRPLFFFMNQELETTNQIKEKNKHYIIWRCSLNEKNKYI